MEHLTSESFEEKVTKADKPVIVDFYAEWCGPCKMFGPIFEEVAGENDNVGFYKVNVDEAQEVAQKFGVRSIPTILFFKEGKVVDQVMGMMPKDKFTDVVQKFAA